MNAPRHFIDLSDIGREDLRQMIEDARQLKRDRQQGDPSGDPLAGRTLAMIFEKNSTRTRVSFEVAMHELGGMALSLNGGDLQLGRGETIADTARVLSRYVHAILMRCHSHEELLELARHASVPVINGLTNYSHPCQLMADIMTFEEHRGPIAGRTLAWVGDGNNVANTWIMAAAQFDFSLRLACPKALSPSSRAIQWARERGARIELSASPMAAAKGADAIVTDTWVSMGDADAEERLTLLAPYQVTPSLMAAAGKDAVFLHCLPAHRGEEVAAEVIDGPASVVWDEAENRLHVQKSILLWCLEGQ